MHFLRLRLGLEGMLLASQMLLLLPSVKARCHQERQQQRHHVEPLVEGIGDSVISAASFGQVRRGTDGEGAIGRSSGWAQGGRAGWWRMGPLSGLVVRSCGRTIRHSGGRLGVGLAGAVGRAAGRSGSPTGGRAGVWAGGREVGRMVGSDRPSGGQVVRRPGGHRARVHTSCPVFRGIPAILYVNFSNAALVVLVCLSWAFLAAPLSVHCVFVAWLLAGKTSDTQVAFGPKRLLVRPDGAGGKT